ncbi:MAG: carboxymuconolactone decarboxylase family protein [Sphingobacteriales bacterium]|nr:MAG: carboxymuconolactone decarboxylase family protein [Sphingobacteriales bacterium]
MKSRIDYSKAGNMHKGIQHVFALSQYTQKTVDPILLHLIDIRVSQINGCAFCLDMHTQEAQYEGEDRRRINTVATWQECAWFSDKERAALDWAESVTLLSETHVPDAVFERLQAHFSEDEIIDLTLAVATINTWNRIAVSFRTVPGAMDEYISKRYAHKAATV